MSRVARAWRLHGNTHEFSAKLALCFRMTTAALLSLALAQLLNVPLALWTVLTAVIVTQMSVGGSLKATFDYLLGTIAGAFYAGAVGVLVPHGDEITLLGPLAIAVAPLALLAAIKPSFAVAPMTAVMVLLAPTITHLDPTASAFYRFSEVALGGITGLAVSLLIWPARAHVLAIEAAASMLALMAQVLSQLSAGFTRRPDPMAVQRIQDSVDHAFARLDIVGTEAQRERITYLVARPDLGPLSRTLRRLRHDLALIGRTAAVPLPEALQPQLGPPLADVIKTAADYLRASSAALVTRQVPSPLGPVADAADRYAAAMAALRREGLMRNLPDEAAERIFALGFALEQLKQNFGDLNRCVTDFAR
jgi:uncharacterized membrane protein YccC